MLYSRGGEQRKEENDFVNGTMQNNNNEKPRISWNFTLEKVLNFSTPFCLFLFFSQLYERSNMNECLALQRSNVWSSLRRFFLPGL